MLAMFMASHVTVGPAPVFSCNAPDVASIGEPDVMHPSNVNNLGNNPSIPALMVNVTSPVSPPAILAHHAFCCEIAPPDCAWICVNVRVPCVGVLSVTDDGPR